MPEDDTKRREHKWRIKDARGRRVTAMDPTTMHLLHQHDIIEAQPLKAIAEEDGLKITRTERAGLIIGIITLLTITSLFTYSIIVEGLSDAPYAKTSALLYFSFVPWLIWFIMRRRRFDKVAPAMLKHSRCPHCGYDLSNLPVDSTDNTTICPECGCAWELTGEPASS